MYAKIVPILQMAYSGSLNFGPYTWLEVQGGQKRPPLSHSVALGRANRVWLLLGSWYCIFGGSMSGFIVPNEFSLLKCLKVSFL